jgi:hypothetical protein
MNLLQKLNHYNIMNLDEDEVRLLISADQLKRTKERKAAQVKYGRGGGTATRRKNKVQRVQEDSGD